MPFITFLAYTWAFYILALATVVVSYIWVMDTDDRYRDGYFPFGPTLIVGAFIYILATRFDVLKQFIIWPNIMATIGGYLLIGFFVSLFRYVRRLSEFKEYATERKSENFKGSIDSEYINSMRGDLKYKFHNVTFEEKTGKFSLDHKRSNITRHWIYWPFFLVSVVFDPIGDFVKFSVKRLGFLYQHLSKKYAV